MLDPVAMGTAIQADLSAVGFDVEIKTFEWNTFLGEVNPGLEGKADANNDKQITNGELLAYMDKNVSKKASELGRKQNPSLAGKSDQILLRY